MNARERRHLLRSLDRKQDYIATMTDDVPNVVGITGFASRSTMPDALDPTHSVGRGMKLAPMPDIVWMNDYRKAIVFMDAAHERDFPTAPEWTSYDSEDRKDKAEVRKATTWKVTRRDYRQHVDTAAPVPSMTLRPSVRLAINRRDDDGRVTPAELRNVYSKHLRSTAGKRVNDYIVNPTNPERVRNIERAYIDDVINERPERSLSRYQSSLPVPRPELVSGDERAEHVREMMALCQFTLECIASYPENERANYESSRIAALAVMAAYKGSDFIRDVSVKGERPI